jgi:hypothetical protein
VVTKYTAPEPRDQPGGVLQAPGGDGGVGAKPQGSHLSTAQACNAGIPSAAGYRSTGRCTNKGVATWVGALAGVIAAVGLLHTPLLRPFVMGSGGCPMGGRKLSTVQAEVARKGAIREERGSDRAPQRPALVFALDATSMQDARTWASDHHVHCERARDALLHCPHVPSEALGLPPSPDTTADLSLEFDLHDRLVNVTTFRTHLHADCAARTASEIESSLTGRLGPPAKAGGAFDPERLSRPAAYSVATRRYRFADYLADVTAMNMPTTGVALREQYMSAR